MHVNSSRSHMHPLPHVPLVTSPLLVHREPLRADDESVGGKSPPELLFTLFKELVKGDRTRRMLYISVIKVLTPNDVEKFLVLRRESKSMPEEAHAAMGWEARNARGAKRSGAAASGATRQRRKSAKTKEVRYGLGYRLGY